MSNDSNFYDYNDLDFLLNTLYDYIYNSKDSVSKTCYKLNPIIKKEMVLEDIKIIGDENIDKKKIFESEFKFMMTHTHPTTKINKHYFKRYTKSSYPSTLVIYEYDNKNNRYDDIERPEVINMMAQYLFGELALTDKFNHILLPLVNFDISVGELRKITDNIITDKYKGYDENIMLCVNVTEHFFKMNSLEDYLNENTKNMTLLHWQVLIFQVLFTLAKISERYSKFRHNHLDLRSIFVYSKSIDSKPDIYQLGKTMFKVPNVGIEIKITNFDKSYSADYPYNYLYNRNIVENPYYDVHYFLNSLYFNVKKLKIEKDLQFKIIEFIKEIIPDKFFIEEEIDFKGLDESYYEQQVASIIMPSTLIKKNNFFSGFITDKINMADMSASPIENKQERINKKKEKTIEYSYSSPTENSQYSFRMLGRDIKKTKNSKHKKISNKIGGNISYRKNLPEQYYNMTKMKGTRNLNQSRKNRNSLSMKENSIYSRAEEVSDFNDDIEDESTQAKAESIKRQKKGPFSKKSNKAKSEDEKLNNIARALKSHNSESETSMSLSDTASENKSNNHAMSESGQASLLKGIPEGYSGELPEYMKNNQSWGGIADYQTQPNIALPEQNAGPNNGPRSKINVIGQFLGVQPQNMNEGSMNDLPTMPGMPNMGALAAMNGSMPSMGMGMPMPSMEMGMPMPSMGMGMPEGSMPQMPQMPPMPMPQGMPGMPPMGSMGMPGLPPMPQMPQMGMQGMPQMPPGMPQMPSGMAPGMMGGSGQQKVIQYKDLKNTDFFF
jgi:hypothetical protein